MKNPKSNYIGEARRIRRKRMIIRGIIAGAVILLVFFAFFFKYILSLKKDIDEEFPSNLSELTETGEISVSTAPSSSETTAETGEVTTTTTPPETETTPESTPDPESTETTTGLESTETGDPSDPSDPSATTETTVNLLPDDWSDQQQVLFPQKYPLQTVTHAERDQSYAALKHSVKKYLEEHKEARIGFYYINLNTNEAFGYNEAQPFVVGSSVYLPMTMLIYDDVRAGTRSMDAAVPFQKSSIDGKLDTKMGEVPEGKQYFLWQLTYLALRDGDSAAMNMLMENAGGQEGLLKRLSQMSSCIDFSAVQNYFDFQGVQQSGDHRSSAYDLATFAQMLYWRYMSYPDVYQNLIDALGSSDRTNGVARQIPSNATVLHRHGSNSEFHAESDVAIILGPEPVIVCVTVEAETPELSQEIQSALGALVYNFISLCHA